MTGGASGIGAAIVELLQREGTGVSVLDLQTNFDVSDPLAWEAVPPVDLACLNAGVLSGVEDITMLDDEQYQRVVGTNVDGVVWGVRRMARVMSPGSAIVVTASVAGLDVMASDPLYALTKHALVGFVRSAAPQLARRGIRLNMVNPGFVDTPLLAAKLRNELRANRVPLAEPRDVAEAVLSASYDKDSGQAWIVQAGRDPLKFVFPRVPGPHSPRQHH